MKKKEIKTTTAPTEKRSAIIASCGFKVKTATKPKTRYVRRPSLIKRVINWIRFFIFSVAFILPCKSSPLVSCVSNPVSTMSQPVSTTSQPVSTTSQPVATMSQPISTTSQPVSTTSQPVATMSQPVATMLQPVATMSQPVATMLQPVSTTSPPVGSSTNKSGLMLIYNDLAFSGIPLNMEYYLISCSVSQRFKLPLPQV